MDNEVEGSRRGMRGVNEVMNGGGYTSLVVRRRVEE